MALGSSHPTAWNLRLDPSERIMEPVSQQVAAARRYARLSALLIASLVLHLCLLAGVVLLEAAPPRRTQTAQEIPVDLVTEVPHEPRHKPKPVQKSTAQKAAAPAEDARKPNPLLTPKAEAKPKPASLPAKQETQQKQESQPEAPKPTAPAAKPPPQHARAKPDSEIKPERTEAKPQPLPPKPRGVLKPQVPPQNPLSEEAGRVPPPAAMPAPKAPLPTEGLAVRSTSETFRAVAVPAPSPDGDVPLSYDTIVASKLELARRFPPEARARGAHGAATVAFLLDVTGNVVKVKLMRSSGDAALDVESLAMVVRAAPFPPPPPGAEREFAIVVDFDPRQ